MKSSGRSHQKPSQPPQNPEALIRDILIRAKQTGDDRKPNFASLLQIALNDPEDTEIITLLEEKLQESEMENLLAPDAFRATAPTQFDDVDGDIVLGMTSNNTVYGINRDALCRHMLTAGSSGSGKTSLLKILVAQLINRSS